MSKIARFTLKPFGSTGPSGDFGQFGSLAAGTPTFTKDPATIQSLAAWLQGWAAETLANNRPALEDFNAVDFVYGQALCYILQQGIPEWIATKTYYTNSFVQVAGVVYISLIDDNINYAPSTNPTRWTAYVPNPQVGLGAWDASITKGVNYHALTDGFVIVSFGAGTSDIYSDATATPTILRASESSPLNGSGCICCPIKKGDYWRADLNSGSFSTAMWIPLGA